MMEIAYKYNGRSVTKEEFDRLTAHKNGIQEVIESRCFPVGHSTFWENHRTISACVMPSQAAEHAEWMRKEGITGCEQNADGTVSAGSQRDFDKLLKAKGLESANSAGTKVIDRKIPRLKKKPPRMGTKQ